MHAGVMHVEIDVLHGREAAEITPKAAGGKDHPRL
jgi:hypothetical protein